LSIDTVFFERYAQHQIREIPVFRFPEKLFWPLISGFDQSYFTSVGNIVLIGDDLDELKNFLTDIEDDETWGKSVAHNKFLETTLLESNISVYINTPKVWNMISQGLQPKWKKFVKDNQMLLRSMQLGAIQFSHLNNNYYTNISVTYRPAEPAGPDQNKRQERFVTNFSSKISRLYSVKSHVNRSDELLVQDSLNDLSLVSTDGNVTKSPV
jgi:hypothetical protein